VERLGPRLGNLVIAVATGLGIVALVIPLFLNPVWVGFEQGRAEAAAWTGFSEADLRVATDAILADLVLGPADFDVEVAGQPVLNERERTHMRDVRGVFMAFFALAVGLVVAAAIVVARRGRAGRAASWRAIRSGSLGLVVVLVAAGGAAVLAFDVLFEVFHRLFFAGGSYTFDPATERLVQLFPFRFWQETAMAVGVVSIVVAAIVAVIAHRRLERSTAGSTAGATPAADPVVGGTAG
jgi:integral membrane protein (TIGR01906 family)